MRGGGGGVCQEAVGRKDTSDLECEYTEINTASRLYQVHALDLDFSNEY